MSQNHWQISSACQVGNSCVGVRRDGDKLQMRESDQPTEVVTLAPGALKALVIGVKDGRFDHLA
ncbi:DUF397 domain-containing protein [Streptomyces sp. NPDC003077]|uniref:DUF397 domain-containing protein n=1 Tax=Streptomyces sp. NPDC003077 TaxID=3154443 RepID=UPI00339E4E04